MRGIHAMLFSLSFALLAAGTRAGALPPDTVATALSDACLPVVATAPTSGTPHVAYIDQDTLNQAWKVSSSWQTEVAATGVVSSTNEGLDFQIRPDRTPIALYWRSNRLEFAMRVSGGWVAESLSVAPNRGPTLAVSPATGEPVAARGWRPSGSNGPFVLAPLDSRSPITRPLRSMPPVLRSFP